MPAETHTERKLPVITLKQGRDWHLRRGHPWAFSGAVQSVPQRVEPGDLVQLHDASGAFVAKGYYNPATDIAVRVLTLDREEEIDLEFLRGRIADALELRRRAIDCAQTNAYRVLNAEGDYLPGLIVDRYADVLVVQSHTAGADKLMDLFLSALESVLEPAGIVLRRDVRVRKREGLPLQEPAVARGRLPAELVVRENGLRFAIDVIRGQKTGFFTDQRDKRLALQRYVGGLGEGATLLNLFSYSGGFAIYAATACRDLITTNVDQSADALALAKRNFELNGLDASRHLFEEHDVFEWAEARAKDAPQYDVVVVDPPAFAKSAREKQKSMRAYARLNEMSMRLLKRGGTLLTCSCSGAISLDEFQECVREGAAQAHRLVKVVEVFQHGPDHPANLFVPELSYLKALLCQVS